MHYPLQLSEHDVSQFQENGFLHTPGIFTEEEMLDFRTAVDTEIARRTAHDQRDVADKTRYEQSFIQCMRLWETSADVARFSFHPGLAGIAAQLLQVPELLLWQDQALYKEAGGQATTAHQDQPFWPIGDVPLVSAWIPLVDVSAEMGAMAYVPGSHRHGGLRVVDITHSTEPYDILQDPALDGIPPRSISAQAGDVIWHHGFTVHQAAANQSEAMRRVFTTVYMASGYPRTKPWPVFPLDRAGVAVGDPMQGEGLPRVWPATAPPQPPTERGQAVGPQHHA